MEMEITINIIPSDYKGDYKNTLGYCWADFATKTAGIDIIVDVTDSGCDYASAAKKAIKENGADSAYVNCMWCGGFSGIIKGDTETDAIDVDVKKYSTPLTMEEEAAQATITDRIEQRTETNTHAGWCYKCKSYCYGDCTS